MAKNAMGAPSAIRMTFASMLRSILILLTAASCGGGGGSNSPPAPPPVVTLNSIQMTPATPSTELGIAQQFAAIAAYSDGSTKDISSGAVWNSSDQNVATVDALGAATTRGVGIASIQAQSGSVTGTSVLTVTAPGHYLLRNSGLYLPFERRGATSGFLAGEALQNWNQTDSVLGTTVAAEASLQLDQMKAMGVNTVTYELRAANADTNPAVVPPVCNVIPVLGMQFPKPTAVELTNLKLLLDLLQNKGMKLWLRLVNTNMEQQPPTNSQTWLGSILGAIGNHPALDLVLFEGDAHLNPGPNGTSVCGVPAEPPLWLGPTAIPATYVQWAIGYAISIGVAPRKLSAEAVVGSYLVESMPPAGGNATAGHLWSPISVLKTIFDNLQVAPNQRTYALSLYEHRKCIDAGTLACVDLDPHTWADQTLQHVTQVVGSGPRIVAPELGIATPVTASWSTAHALESLVFLLNKYAIDGGSFWRWTNYLNSDDLDHTLATPVKPRGLAFVYNAVQKEILDMGGFHVPLVPNGSFEGPVNPSGVPTSWTTSGSGAVSQYLLTQDAGQPEVPSRGTHAMRMISGSGASDQLTATSTLIPVVPSTAFTTTSNLRFSWTGDPNSTGVPANRPQIFVSVSYFQKSTAPSAQRLQDTQTYFQESSTTGFATFPIQYTTPSDAAFVTISFGINRNGLPTLITLDVDNVR